MRTMGASAAPRELISATAQAVQLKGRSRDLPLVPSAMAPDAPHKQLPSLLPLSSNFAYCQQTC